MRQLTLGLKIKNETEIDEKDLWNFDNFDWLKGNPDNLIVFFTKAIPRIDRLMIEYPKDKVRLKKLKDDCRRRLKILAKEKPIIHNYKDRYKEDKR